MSDGPGDPSSPHQDPDPYESPQHRDLYRPSGGSTRPEDGWVGWQPPAGSSRTDYPAQDPGYGRGHANSPPAPHLQTPTSLDPLAGLRAERDPRTGISRVPEPMKIGIWGSPQSGKSTFLAALQQAILSHQPSVGEWTLTGLEERSTKVLADWTNRLVADQRFPEVTAQYTEVPLSWRFYGDLAGSRYQPPWRRLRRAPESAGFDLDLIDVSGEVFGRAPKQTPQAVVDRTLRHLADAQGLIFLFDPIPGPTTPSVEEYLTGPLAEIKRLVMEKDRIGARYLPHHVCVCVTKFDDPHLFRQACEAGYVNSGRDGIPRVRDRHAKRFFEALCDGKFWPAHELGTPGPQFARRLLQNSFHPARTRYYVTSAIGFKRPRDGDFDPYDYANVRQGGGDKLIMGAVNPINVLEPLVDLHMKLRQGRVA